MKLHFYYIFLFFCWTSAAFSQDSLPSPSQLSAFPDSVFIVENTVIHGNSHTKDFVILREMTLKPGSPITRQALEYDKSRIYSLGLFNQVQMWVKPSAEAKAELVVEVSERWYLFPYPIFGIKDRDWAKVYYGAGLLHNNFRGRNEKLLFSLALGFDPSLALSYRNPFLDGEGRSFLVTQISYNKVRNRSQQFGVGQNDFDERHFSINLSLGKRFGIEHTVWFGAGYEVVDISDYTPARTLSSSGKDAYPIIGVGYIYDTRDLAGYPSYGTFVRATVTKFGVSLGNVNIVRYAGDVRRYVPLMANVVLTGRVFTDIAAAGTIPGYNHVYFGYSERIRGHFNEVMEGENIFGVSSELHLTLLPTRYFVVDFLPPAFGVWKFGVVAAFFGDAGITRYRWERFALNQFVKGYGVGLNFLLPYDAVIRTEYAWNEVRRGQFIFEMGASF